MQVVALAPQFVIASPEGDASESLGRTTTQLSELKLVKTSPAAEGDSGGGSGRGGADQETKEGLKRLAELIRKKRREVPAEPSAARVLEFPKGGSASDALASQSEPGETVRPKQLDEKRVDQSSHEFTPMIIEWSQRPTKKSMATVVREEMERRRGLGVYRFMKKSAGLVSAIDGETYRPLNTIS